MPANAYELARMQHKFDSTTTSSRYPMNQSPPNFVYPGYTAPPYHVSHRTSTSATSAGQMGSVPYPPPPFLLANLPINPGTSAPRTPYATSHTPLTTKGIVLPSRSRVVANSRGELFALTPIPLGPSIPPNPFAFMPVQQPPPTVPVLCRRVLNQLGLRVDIPSREPTSRVRFRSTPKIKTSTGDKWDSKDYEILKVILGNGALLNDVPALFKWLRPCEFHDFEIMLVFLEVAYRSQHNHFAFRRATYHFDKEFQKYATTPSSKVGYGPQPNGPVTSNVSKSKLATFEKQTKANLVATSRTSSSFIVTLPVSLPASGPSGRESAPAFIPIKEPFGVPRVGMLLNRVTKNQELPTTTQRSSVEPSGPAFISVKEPFGVPRVGMPLNCVTRIQDLPTSSQRSSVEPVEIMPRKPTSSPSAPVRVPEISPIGSPVDIPTSPPVIVSASVPTSVPASVPSASPSSVPSDPHSNVPRPVTPVIHVTKNHELPPSTQGTSAANPIVIPKEPTPDPQDMANTGVSTQTSTNEGTTVATGYLAPPIPQTKVPDEPASDGLWVPDLRKTDNRVDQVDQSPSHSDLPTLTSKPVTEDWPFALQSSIVQQSPVAHSSSSGDSPTLGDAPMPTYEFPPSSPIPSIDSPEPPSPCVVNSKTHGAGSTRKRIKQIKPVAKTSPYKDLRFSRLPVGRNPVSKFNKVEDGIIFKYIEASRFPVSEVTAALSRLGCHRTVQETAERFRRLQVANKKFFRSVYPRSEYAYSGKLFIDPSTVPTDINTAPKSQNKRPAGMSRKLEPAASLY